jgi:hypothetical protein
MDFEEVMEAVKAATEGKHEITCHDTRHLADQLGVEWTVIGRACDKLSIGLKRCQWAPYCVCDWSLTRQGIAKERQDAAAAKAAAAAGAATDEAADEQDPE